MKILKFIFESLFKKWSLNKMQQISNNSGLTASAATTCTCENY